MLKRRIKRITIKNYRSITDLTVEMPDLMVLVGENGSGKSNFVSALRFLSDSIKDGLDNAISHRNGIGEILYKGDVSIIDIEVHIEIETANYIYGFSLETNADAYEVKREFLKRDTLVILDYYYPKWHVTPNNIPLRTPSSNLTLPFLTDYPEITPIRDFLSEISLFIVSPQELRGVGLNSNAKFMKENGHNIGAILMKIETEYPHLKDTIQEYMSYIFPNIHSFETQKISDNFINIVLSHQNGKTFNLWQESDGTRRILAMLTALHQPHTPSLLAIEEPELFIHPGALALLCEIIEEASLRQQIIITTHSPDLIAKFDVNAIRVVEMTDNGTKIDVIADSQLEAINEKLFGTGDILRIDGRLKRKEYEA